MSEYAQSLGISITNQCYDCMLIDEICGNCQELADARATDIAHQIVDEGNMQYKGIWSRTDDQPSGHDWVASQTVIKPQEWTAKFTEKWDDDNPFKLIELSVQFVDTDEPILIRNEYLPPIVQLQDGGVYEELWELEDYTQRQREVECKWCHLLTPKMFNDCQDCDKPLEHNIR